MSMSIIMAHYNLLIAKIQILDLTLGIGHGDLIEIWNSACQLRCHRRPILLLFFHPSNMIMSQSKAIFFDNPVSQDRYHYNYLSREPKTRRNQNENFRINV